MPVQPLPDQQVTGETQLTVEELKARVWDADEDRPVDDDILTAYLAAAFEQAQAPPPLGCGRLLTPDPFADDDPDVTRTFMIGPGTVSRTILIPDARNITSVTVDGTATTAYAQVSRNEHIVSLTFPLDSAAVVGGPQRTVIVTGRFGFSTIPDLLKEAIYQLAARLYFERAAGYADQIAMADGAAVQSYYRQLPPRVKLAFASFAPPAQNVRLA